MKPEYIGIGNFDVNNYVYAHCKCPLTADYAIKWPRIKDGKSHRYTCTCEDCGTEVEVITMETKMLWKCERCGKLIPYMADFCHDCAYELFGEPPKPFKPPIENEEKCDGNCKNCHWWDEPQESEVEHVKITIDISEDVYTRLFDNGIQDNEIAVDDVCEMARAIRLGTPLPKHGKLIDKIKEGVSQ